MKLSGNPTAYRYPPYDRNDHPQRSFTVYENGIDWTSARPVLHALGEHVEDRVDALICAKVIKQQSKGILPMRQPGEGEMDIESSMKRDPYNAPVFNGSLWLV